MSNYDFHTLSPADFEDLVRDLLQAELKLRLESFMTGRDEGIDLRYSKAVTNELIVQCKHYVRSGYTALRREVQQNELARIRRLRPRRYILCTSVGMTPSRKDSLLRILRPYCQTPQDIFGQQDLNNLLGLHPAIESAHHKLWLTGSEVLERIVHLGLFAQTALERTAIERRLALYVKTPAFDRAQEILDEHNYCIISGIPGIGKTTLAEILIVHLLEAGYELVVARQNIREALRPGSRTKKRVVYYDDFLGRSSLGDMLQKNEEQNIVRLLRNVVEAPWTKAILTTREYILAQARNVYERLDDEALELAKCIVDLEQYNRLSKARILYNHLYYQDVPQDLMGSLLDQGRYRAIVDHQNYSPRVIEWMTGVTGRKISSEEYAKEFLANLDDPCRVWSHAFECDLSIDSRQLLFCLATLPDATLLECARECWRATFQHDDNAKLPGEMSMRFERSLRELEGSFVLTSRCHDMTMIKFHNSSIRDFICRKIGSSSELAKELLRRAVYFDQVLRIVSLDREGKIKSVPTGLIDDLDLLAKAVRSTIRSAAAGLDALSDHQGYFLCLPMERQLGRRVCTVATWAECMGSVGLRDVARTVAEEFIHEGVFRSEKVDQTCSMLESVFPLRAGLTNDDEVLVEDALRAINARLEGAGAIDDWSAWGEFLGKFGDCLPGISVDEWHEKATEFCEEETDRLIESDRSADSLWGDRQELEEAATQWGIEIHDALDRLEEEASRREAPDEAFGSGGWHTPTTRQNDGASNEEIERLFDSLR